MCNKKRPPELPPEPLVRVVLVALVAGVVSRFDFERGVEAPRLTLRLPPVRLQYGLKIPETAHTKIVQGGDTCVMSSP